MNFSRAPWRNRFPCVGATAPVRGRDRCARSAAATSATISNSTIAFNAGGTCGGLYASTAGYINSTIVANNAAATPTGCHGVNAGFGSGTGNIVGVADAGVTLPGDTFVGGPH